MALQHLLSDCEWLTPREAAEYCRVSDKTIRNWAADGRFVARRCGPKLWQIHRASFLQYLDIGKVRHAD
jgi:excisionase family DNA binding protein